MGWLLKSATTWSILFPSPRSVVPLKRTVFDVFWHDNVKRIKLELKQDGTISKSEILDHERMNRPGQKFYKILAESALRAVRICQPLRVPQTGYEKWKNIQLNFNPTEMLKG